MIACQCHWQNGSIRKNTKYVLFYAHADILFLHSSTLFPNDDDDDDKTRILQNRNIKEEKKDWLVSSFPTTQQHLYFIQKCWLRRRRDNVIVPTRTGTLVFIDEWAEQSAWLPINIIHLKEWVMMHNCRSAWIELKIFTRFRRLIQNAKIYIWISSNKIYIHTHSAMLREEEKNEAREQRKTNYMHSE